MAEDQITSSTVDLSSITETEVEPADYIPLIGDEEYEGNDNVANQEIRQEDQEKEQNPIMEKLLLFMNDPFRKTVKFSHDISTHDRIMVHKFVQDNNLTCESTGNNRNHEFVVGKVISGKPLVREDAVPVKSSDGSNINDADNNFGLDFEYDSEISYEEEKEDNASHEEMAELEEEEDNVSHEELSEEEKDTQTACGVCGCSGVKCSCSAVDLKYVIRRRSHTSVSENNEKSTVIHTNTQVSLSLLYIHSKPFRSLFVHYFEISSSVKTIIFVVLAVKLGMWNTLTFFRKSALMMVMIRSSQEEGR